MANVGTISSKEMCYIRMHNAKPFSKLGNSHLPLQVRKLRQKGSKFSKKFSVNLSLKSVLPYHIFRMRTVIYYYNETTPHWRYLPDVSSQGWAQGWKALSCKAELSTELWSFISKPAGAGHGIWRSPATTSLCCPVVATELMWLGHRQFTPAVSPGLPKMRDDKLYSLVLIQMGFLSAGTLWMLWEFRALGAEQSLTPVIALSAGH